MERPAPRRGRALILRVAAVGLATGLAAGGWFARQILVVGVGHKAKTLCSGVFVSGRSLDDVQRELQTGDLALLRHVSVQVHQERPSITASALGLVTREALYRPHLGCTLLLDGLTPPVLETGPEAEGVEAPASPGLDEGVTYPAIEAAVARAFAEPDLSRLRRTAAVVIVHHGRIVGERYAPGLTAHTPLPGWSMSKSVINALVGNLVRDGRLSLDAPAPVPEWRQPGDPRAAITVDHLLRMSSGLHFDEGMASPRSDVMRMLFNVGDAGAFAARRPLAAAPGTVWRYSSVTTNLLARIVRDVLADDEAYLTFPRRSLFGPLGMSTAVVETDAAGTFVGSSYTYASARDWARFGLLYLADGRWNGVRLLPDGWVTYTATPAPADPAGRYGAHFWLQVPEDYAGANPDLPAPAIHAAGHEGQFVTIVPSRQAVIVRLGRTRLPGAWDHAAFVRDVLAALASDAPTAGPDPDR